MKGGEISGNVETKEIWDMPRYEEIWRYGYGGKKYGENGNKKQEVTMEEWKGMDNLVKYTKEINGLRSLL